jgi:hypothetical protein
MTYRLGERKEDIWDFTQSDDNLFFASCIVDLYKCLTDSQKPLLNPG